MSEPDDNPAMAEHEVGGAIDERSAMAEVADALSSVIVVRQAPPTPAFAVPGLTPVPAPATLIAMSADRDTGTRRLRGMVVDHTAVPEVFSSSRREEAARRWQRFLDGQGARDREDLNRRHKQGLTPYHIETRTRSPMFGVLHRAGRPVREGLALRDVIGVPIAVDGMDDDRDFVTTISATRHEASAMLSARLGQRVVVDDDDEGELMAAVPPVGEGGRPLVLLLQRLGELADLRALVPALRAIRGLAAAPPEDTTLGRIRALAMRRGTGVATP